MTDTSRSPVVVEPDPSPQYPDPFCGDPQRLRNTGKDILDVRYACTYRVEGPTDKCPPGSQTAVSGCTLGPGDTLPLGCTKYFSPASQCVEMRSWAVVSWKPADANYVSTDDYSYFDGFVTDESGDRRNVFIQLDTSKRKGDFLLLNLYGTLKDLRKLKVGTAIRGRITINGLEGDWEWSCTPDGKAEMKLLGKATAYTDVSSLMSSWIADLRLPTVKTGHPVAAKVFETTIEDSMGKYDFRLDVDEALGEAKAILPGLGPSKMTGLHRVGPAKISGWAHMNTMKVRWEIEAVPKGATFDCMMVEVGTPHRYTTPDGTALDAFLRSLDLRSSDIQ